MCAFLFLQSQLYGHVTLAFTDMLTFLHIYAAQFPRRIKSLYPT
jgi:hypothetical protein